MPDRAAAFGLFDRQVAVESERLPVQPGGHQRQQDRRRADQRNHFHAAQVRKRRQVRARVGYAGQARFRDHAGIRSGEHRGQQFGHRFRRRVFVQFGETQRVDRPLYAGAAQKAAGRTGVFDDEVFQAVDYGSIVLRQHIPYRRIADRGRQHVDFPLSHYSLV